MSSQESKDFSVSKVLPYSSKYSENMKNSMAILKFNTDWHNFFSQCEGAVNELIKIENAIKKGTIDLTKVNPNSEKKYGLDPVHLYNIKQIWDGGCFITRERDPFYQGRFIPNSEKFHYDRTKINHKDHLLEVIPLPSLDNMTPVGRIKEATLLIQITQSIPLYLAFEGMDFDTLIREGHMFYLHKGKMIAKFTPTDLSSKVKKTYQVGRNYYWKTIKILKQKFLDNWNPLTIDIHNLILFAEMQEENLESLFANGLGNFGQNVVDTSKIPEVEDGDRPYNFETETEEPEEE